MVTIALKVTFFMRRIILLPILLLMLFTARSGAQTITIDRVEPMNWWVGMNDPEF